MANVGYPTPASSMPGDIGTCDRRQDLRRATQHLVKLHCDPTLFGELTNLSRAGAEVELNSDRGLEADAQTVLELLDGTAVPAVVAWRRGRSVGLTFDLTLADASERLHLDHLGQDFFLGFTRQHKVRAGLAG